jgi:hypothetical protein
MNLFRRTGSFYISKNANESFAPLRKKSFAPMAPRDRHVLSPLFAGGALSSLRSGFLQPDHLLLSALRFPPFALTARVPAFYPVLWCSFIPEGKGQ